MLLGQHSDARCRFRRAFQVYSSSGGGVRRRRVEQVARHVASALRAELLWVASEVAVAARASVAALQSTVGSSALGRPRARIVPTGHLLHAQLLVLVMNGCSSPNTSDEARSLDLASTLAQQDAVIIVLPSRDLFRASRGSGLRHSLCLVQSAGAVRRQ